jgi:hypothetical protein
MKINGQLPYIFKQPWYREGEAAIDIEINFYMNRGYNSIFGFHKDTGGDNLFFNLIFNNKEPMLATEWTEDLSQWGEKASKKTNEMKKIEIEPQKHAKMKERMPKRAIKAIKEARRTVRTQYSSTNPLIRGGTVGPVAYVSAVDELGWHSTPSPLSRAQYQEDYSKEMSSGVELSADTITGVPKDISVATNISGRRRANSLVSEAERQKLVEAYEKNKLRSFLRTWVRIRKLS